MIKRIQNQVTGSRLTLPVVIFYGIGIWLLCGLLQKQLWVQFACFALSTYLVVQINNVYALIRIYSRMVSVAFIFLSCMVCFLFPSIEDAIAQLCILSGLMTLLSTYQDKDTIGRLFYTFVFIGLGSLADIHLLWNAPLFWIISAFFIYSLSWRGFFASCLGLILPYWFMGAWVLWQHGFDFSIVRAHFAPLAEFHSPITYETLPLPYYLSFAFIVILQITGIIHFLRTSFNDKLRTRQFYYTFIFLDLTVTILLAIQPQHYDLLIREMIIFTSPLIGHFISLTHTRITNIAFYVIAAIALILTAINLWNSSSIF